VADGNEGARSIDGVFTWAAGEGVGKLMQRGKTLAHGEVAEQRRGDHMGSRMRSIDESGDDAIQRQRVVARARHHASCEKRGAHEIVPGRREPQAEAKQWQRGIVKRVRAGVVKRSCESADELVRTF